MNIMSFDAGVSYLGGILCLTGFILLFVALSIPHTSKSWLKLLKFTLIFMSLAAMAPTAYHVLMILWRAVGPTFF